MPPPDAETTRWFAEEVQPHEAQLRAYLRSKFSSHTDIEDLVQETFARLIEIRQQTALRSTKAYLFTIARNAGFDFFRRKKIVQIDHIADLELLSVLEGGPGVADTVAHKQELQILADAIEALPERCRRVLTLRKIHGLSHREIAQSLGISENTVNAQVAIGVLRLRDYLRARGIDSANCP